MNSAIKELRIELKGLLSNRYIGEHDNNADFTKYIDVSLGKMNYEMKTMLNHRNHHLRSLNNIRNGKKPLNRFDNSIQNFSIDFLHDTVSDKFSKKTHSAVNKAQTAFKALQHEMYMADAGYDAGAVKLHWQRKPIDSGLLRENIAAFRVLPEGVTASSSAIETSLPTKVCFYKMIGCETGRCGHIGF